jgi:hypothetical protein
MQEGLVTVCAWTNKVLDDGQWVRFEEYLDRRLGVKVTHGISEEALREQLKHMRAQRRDQD